MARRGPKIALAATILAAGVGTALFFRKTPTEESVTAEASEENLVLRQEAPAAEGPLWAGSINTPAVSKTVTVPTKIPEYKPLAPEPIATATRDTIGTIADDTIAKYAPPPLPSVYDVPFASQDPRKSGPFAPLTPQAPGPFASTNVPPATVQAAPEKQAVTKTIPIVKPPGGVVSKPSTPTATGSPTITGMSPVPSATGTTASAKAPSSPYVAGYASNAHTAPRKHKITDGDTLASIANRYLGSPSHAQQIYEANRAVLTNPDLLPLGSEIQIPEGIPQPSASSPYDPPLVPVPPYQAQPASLSNLNAANQVPRTRSHQVQAGETLVEVSRKAYGDGRHHEAIFNANRTQLRHPSDVRPGMTLRIP